MEGDGMSKHSISGGAEGEFWKRVRYGAAAAVTVGTGVYTVTSVLKQQGVMTNLGCLCTKHSARRIPHLLLHPAVLPGRLRDGGARAGPT